jgi:hypothetical protein
MKAMVELMAFTRYPRVYEWCSKINIRMMPYPVGSALVLTGKFVSRQEAARETRPQQGRYLLC